MSKSKILLIAFFGSFAQVTFAAAPAGDPWCEFALVKFEDVKAAAENKKAKEMARILKGAGLSDNAYMVDWRSKLRAGPWNNQGNTLVVGLASEQVGKWMKEVGQNSIGLMINGLPEYSPGTAILRVGRTVYHFGYIQADEDELDVDAVKADAKEYLSETGSGRTEVTFMATPEEIAALQKFAELRHQDKIVAKKDVNRKIKKGDVLSPEYSHTGFDFLKESCAGTCTSFVDMRWLEHYDTPEILRKLGKRLLIEPTFIAKRMIYMNFRNPMASSITLFGIENSEKRIDENFIEKNSFQFIHGIPKWTIIPDSPNGGGTSYESTRTPL